VKHQSEAGDGSARHYLRHHGDVQAKHDQHAAESEKFAVSSQFPGPVIHHTANERFHVTKLAVDAQNLSETISSLKTKSIQKKTRPCDVTQQHQNKPIKTKLNHDQLVISSYNHSAICDGIKRETG